MKKVIYIVIILIIFIRLSVYLFLNRYYFLRIFDPVYISDLYSKSQYVIGERSIGGIGDDGLYTFAGYYYLFQGGDVTKVNFEHPPLGKYLIGVSIFLFRNENIINIIYFVILLLYTYKLGELLLKDKLLSVVSAVILSFDPLFLDHLLRSLLDLPFTLFFTLGIYYFLKGLKENKYLYISMFFWGAAFSTRFFPAFIIIYVYLLLIIFIYKRKSINQFLISSFIVPLVYLLCHITFFINTPSFIEFLRHKKWMLSWFTGTQVLAGNIWQNIFTGTYLDSTRKLAVNSHWNIMKPIVATLAVIPVGIRLIQKKNPELPVVYLFTIIYLLYITFLTGGLDKFLMPIYPLMIILAVRSASSFYSIISTWSKKKSAK